MPVDPQLQPILEQLLKLPRFESLSVEQARALATQYNAAGKLPPIAVASVVNRVIPGPVGELPIRIYTPHGTGPFPLMLYFHGSGFVMCNLDTHDRGCRNLCNAAGCVVISVDYRLAPEQQVSRRPRGLLRGHQVGRGTRR